MDLQHNTRQKRSVKKIPSSCSIVKHTEYSKDFTARTKVMGNVENSSEKNLKNRGMDGFVAQGELSYLYSNATLKGHLCRDPKNLV